MKVSVIIPVFNTIQYLAEALDSVLCQTYRNLEIIIIDDGSTDGSERLCDKYAKKDERIRLIHQDNKGLSNARNTGLNIMSGDAVAFLDSDDTYHPDFVKDTIEAMKRYGADLVICKYTTHLANLNMPRNGLEKARPSIKEGLYDRAGSLQALADGTIDHIAWNKVYKSSLWTDIRYPDGYVYEDLDTTYQLLNNCKTVFVLDKPLYFKRIREGSITDTWTKKNISDWLLAHFHYESFIYENIPDIFSEEQIVRIRHKRFCNMLRRYVHFSWEYGKEKEYGKEFRKQILELGREAGILDGCKLYENLLFRMICYYPSALKILGHIFYPIHNFSMTQMHHSER